MIHCYTIYFVIYTVRLFIYFQLDKMHLTGYWEWGSLRMSPLGLYRTNLVFFIICTDHMNVPSTQSERAVILESCI